MESAIAFVVNLLPNIALVTFWLSAISIPLFLFWFLISQLDPDSTNDSVFAIFNSIIVALLSGILLKMTS